MAPEIATPLRATNGVVYRCGEKAADELDAFIARRPVSCEPVGLDVYGRTVARCSANGTDLGEWLVRGGLALDWPKYSKGKYEAEQHDAAKAERAMWAGSYVAPWLYRSRSAVRTIQVPTHRVLQNECEKEGMKCLSIVLALAVNPKKWDRTKQLDAVFLKSRAEASGRHV
ncbi:thermonuclease family protein [Bradyrhizobium sp.]|uniref:thermonuclease family protein n=1 Tax=Bradyrhizobium sp. TaxID=376 RepID=UPI002618BB3D|nr:thermonuclease family protein [Bradyrhizobium sp.]